MASTDIDEYNVGSDVACDVNFDYTNTISSLTCTMVTNQALTELMLVIPTLPALMPLDHILVAVMLFSVATVAYRYRRIFDYYM